MSRYDTLEDWDLIDRYLNGREERAFTALYKRHKPDVYTYLQSKVYPFKDSQDLSQEVWIRVVKHLGNFDPSKVFAAWLRIIARNLMLNYHRDSLMDPLRRAWGVNDGRASNTLTPESLLLTQELLEACVLAMDELPEIYQDVLHRRYYGQMWYKEIAAELGVPLGTVQSRIRRGRKMMRDAVQKGR